MFRFYLFSFFIIVSNTKCFAQFDFWGAHPKNKTDSLVWVYDSFMKAERLIGFDKSNLNLAKVKEIIWDSNLPQNEGYDGKDLKVSKSLLLNLEKSNNTQFNTQCKKLITQLDSALLCISASSKIAKSCYLLLAKEHYDSQYIEVHKLVDDWLLELEKTLIFITEIKQGLALLIGKY